MSRCCRCLRLTTQTEACYRLTDSTFLTKHTIFEASDPGFCSCQGVKAQFKPWRSTKNSMNSFWASDECHKAIPQIFFNIKDSPPCRLERCLLSSYFTENSGDGLKAKSILTVLNDGKEWSCGRMRGFILQEMFERLQWMFERFCHYLHWSTFELTFCVLRNKLSTRRSHRLNQHKGKTLILGGYLSGEVLFSGRMAVLVWLVDGLPRNVVLTFMLPSGWTVIPMWSP